MTDPNQIIVVREIHTGKLFDMTIKEMLALVNEMQPYDYPYKLDEWEEGWYGHCEGDHYEIVKPD